MPKPNPAQAERQRLLKPLLQFLANLPTRLDNLSTPSTGTASPPAPTASKTDATSLLSELHSHINTLRSASVPALFTSDAALEPHDLDRKATALWNQGTRLKRVLEASASAGPSVSLVPSKPHPTDTPELQVLAVLRVFVFLVLDAAAAAARVAAAAKGARSLWDRGHEHVRLLRVAVKVAKACLELGRLEYCTKVLERGADHEDCLAKIVRDEGSADGADVVGAVYPALMQEFFVLRMTLAWKQDNLQLAEMMRLQLINHGDASQIDLSSLEVLADALFEIGKDLFRKKDFYQAAKWLEKSFDSISSQEPDRLSADAGELKLSILHYLVRAQLGLNSEAGRDKARNVLALMENESAERIVVSLLRLDILNSEKEFDTEQYYSVMGHVHKLKEHNPEMACKALDDFLNLRIYSHENEEWIQRCLITRLWITVDKLPEVPGVLEGLQQCFASMADNYKPALAAKATHAAQTLLWKRIDALFRQQKYDVAESWCRLALHRIFSNAGEINTAKINRKILLCQINQRDFTGARATFNQMPESARSAPMTRHIMYKLAIRDQDATLAAECIEEISKGTSNDATLLYACVLEAYSSGDKQQAIVALQKVLAKYHYATPSGVHLPSLIRCTAKLLVSEISENAKEDSSVPEEVCKVFEGAVTAIEKKPAAKTDQTNGFDDKELQWFVTNSYNLALKYFGHWCPELVVRLLECCIRFSDLKAAHRSSEEPFDPVDHVAIAHALAAQQLLQLARKEDNQESQLQFYLRVRKHVKAFQDASKATGSGADGAFRENMNSIARKLVIGDFEAAVQLKTWDDLIKILDDCKSNDASETLQICADMLMASDAPPSVIQHTLEHLTAATSDQITSPPAQQARWLRILYQLSLATHPLHTTQTTAPAAPRTATTDAIISRALALARRSRVSHPHHHHQANQAHSLDNFGNSQTQTQTQAKAATEHYYPPEELEYLATTTFNRAVDAYCAADGEACRRLGGMALELASEMELCGGGRGGGLRAVLMERLVGLGFGGGDGDGVGNGDGMEM